MFKQLLVSILIIVLTFICTKYYLIKYHKIYLEENKIKYILRKRDIEYFKKYSKKIKIEDLEQDVLFYTTEKWKTSTFNYLYYNDMYYIIEPGYYYYFKKGITINSKDIFVFSLKKNK